MWVIVSIKTLNQFVMLSTKDLDHIENVTQDVFSPA